MVYMQIEPPLLWMALRCVLIYAVLTPQSPASDRFIGDVFSPLRLEHSVGGGCGLAPHELISVQQLCAHHISTTRIARGLVPAVRLLCGARYIDKRKEWYYELRTTWWNIAALPCFHGSRNVPAVLCDLPCSRVSIFHVAGLFPVVTASPLHGCAYLTGLGLTGRISSACLCPLECQLSVLERHAGIEPTLSPWKGDVLPLN